jgi:hypothetical protein
MENYLKEMLVTLADAGVEFVVGGELPAFCTALSALLSISTLPYK